MKTKKKHKQEVYTEPEKAPIPTIPNGILKAFLDRHVTVEDSVDVTQVTDGVLWEKGGIERYRVNVWMKQEIEGQFCNNYYIGYSWFMQFNRKEQTLTDKTTGQTNQEDKKYSKIF